MKDTEKLIKDNMFLVYHVLKRFKPQKKIESELVQEGMVGLWQAIDKFDPKSGNKLSTLAVHYIRNRMVDHLRKEKRWTQEMLGFDKFVDNVPNGIPSAEQELFEQQETNWMNDKIRKACGDLTEREEYILTWRLLADTPKSWRDIADMFDTTHSSIKRDERRLKKLIRRNYKHG